MGGDLRCGVDIGQAEAEPKNGAIVTPIRSEEHTSELQSPCNLVCRLLLEKKKQKYSHLPSHNNVQNEYMFFAQVTDFGLQTYHLAALRSHVLLAFIARAVAASCSLGSVLC